VEEVVSSVPFTCTWIETGTILAGSIPQLPQHWQLLKDQGVNSILTLTRRNVCDYSGFMDWLNANNWYQRYEPIPDGGLADDLTMFSAVAWLASDRRIGLTSYVHCRGGIGRTGTILLAYYVLERGLTLSEAKEIVKVRRNYEGNASAVDQGSPQREWIDALESKRVDYRRMWP
jgi:hypothetical protein